MKKQLIIGTVVCAVISGLVVGGLKASPGQASTPTTDPAVAQEIKHQGETLDNHEARITNTENNVKDLQVHTNTPASTNTVVVPQVTTPSAPLPTPSAPPITVIAFQVQPIEGTENSNCMVTYSDATTYTWLWQIVTYNQGTKITSSNNLCDNRLIGNQK